MKQDFWWNLSTIGRKIINPFISVLMVMKNSTAIKEDKWSKIKNLSGPAFSTEINKYAYYPDELFLGGDNTIITPNQFFIERKTNRDCDDWAEMWWWWAKENGHQPYRIMVYEDKNMQKTSHMSCIVQLRNNQKFVLCDYVYGAEVDHYSDCVDRLAKKYGFKNELIIAHY